MAGVSSIQRRRSLAGQTYLVVGRASTPGQVHSIPDQLMLGRAYGDRKGGIWAGDLTFLGTSASKPKLFENELLQAIRAELAKGKKITAIVFYDTQRFDRRGSEYGMGLLNKLRKMGITPFFASSGDIESPRAERRLRKEELDQANELVARNSATLSRGLTTALAAGRRLHCTVRPFATGMAILDPATKEIAYRILDRPDGTQVRVDNEGNVVQTFHGSQRFRKQKYEIPVLMPGDPTEVQTVTLIYRMFLEQDLGTPTIAKELNKLNRLQRRGRPWNSYAVCRLLRNPIYSGKIVAQRMSQSIYFRTGFDKEGRQYELDLIEGIDFEEGDGGRIFPVLRPGDEWFESECPRMLEFLPAELRERARQFHETVLAPQREGKMIKPRRDANRQSDYLLTEILHTAEGRHAMAGTRGGRNGEVRYYRINPRRTKVEQGSPLAGRVRADKIDPAVMTIVEQSLLSDPAMESTIAELIRGGYEDARRRFTRRGELEQQIKNLESELDFARSQARDNSRGAARLLAKIEPQIAAVETELASLPDVPELSDEDIRKEAAGISQWLRQQAGLLMKAEPATAKQFLRTVIRDLTIDLPACVASMDLVVTEEAIAAMGPLGELVYQTAKWTHPGGLPLARLQLPLPPGTCTSCRRYRRAAA